ncbi:MAG: class II aldolase/adducin family protein [Candidatus Caldarchaeales archaeon]
MSLPDIDKRSIDRVMDDVIHVSKSLFEMGLVKSTFGVVSEIIPDTNYVVITPSGFRKEKVTKENLIIVDLDGKVVLGDLRPSTETPMHVYIHKHVKEAKCVIHSHSPMATVFAILKRDIPCITSEQAFMFGGRIPVVKKYSLPGTSNIEELESIAESLRNSKAALLPRHGVIVHGEGAEEALDNAIVVEDIAQMAIFALLLGQPIEFTDREIAYLQEYRRTRYGQKIQKR